MKLPRRQFLHLAAVAAALQAVSRVARAQAYPTRPVRIIVSRPTGGVADIHATLYDKLSFNFIRDIAPVASLIRSPNVMEVNLAVPVKTVPEFIAYAKANPGKLNMAS